MELSVRLIYSKKNYIITELCGPYITFNVKQSNIHTHLPKKNTDH